VRRQYRYWRWRFPDDVVLFQVGRFMECYDVLTPSWVELLGLKRMGRNRRGVRYGFPLGRTATCMRRLIDRGFSVLVVQQLRGEHGSVSKRLPVCRYSLRPTLN
jgi:DNA mismatch repair ATPase MutS